MNQFMILTLLKSIKTNVKSIRDEQKDLIRSKAVLAHTEWTVEGSKANAYMNDDKSCYSYDPKGL